MARRLTIIAIGGLAISAVCLSLASSLAPAGAGDFEVPIFGNLVSLGDVFHDGCIRTRGASPAVNGDSVDLVWDGGDSVRINVPADVHYEPGARTGVTVRGDPDIVQHVRVHDGTIDFECGWHRHDDGRLDVTLPGRALNSFSLNGSGRLTIDNFKAERLKVAIAGSGDVRANGTAERLDITIAGSGNADMSALSVKRARTVIAGSGDASIAPEDEADVVIAGSGNIHLLTQPKDLSTKIAGSGRIISERKPGIPI